MSTAWDELGEQLDRDRRNDRDADILRAEVIRLRSEIAAAEARGREQGRREIQAEHVRYLVQGRDHWQARALDAESKVDGQAWVDLTAERDELLSVVEAAKAWRAAWGTHWAQVDHLIAALVAAVDALNRGKGDNQ